MIAHSFLLIVEKNNFHRYFSLFLKDLVFVIYLQEGFYSHYLIYLIFFGFLVYPLGYKENYLMTLVENLYIVRNHLNSYYGLFGHKYCFDFEIFLLL